MSWKITIDYTGKSRDEVEVPTPHLHTAIDSALFKFGLSNVKTGEYQITAVEV